MLIGYIKGRIHWNRQTVSVIGLTADQIKELRYELADYFGWERITQR